MVAEPKDPEAMSLLELQQVVGAEIEDAKSYIDSQLATDRDRASSYYRGLPFGDEEEGRSQAVSRDVHDTVSAILPSLMRIFFGPEKVVEFVPQGEEDVEAAEQATDYVNYIFTRDNPGFLILMAVFKDALIRKTGIIKWWWDSSEEVRTARYSGLTDEALTLLLEDLAGAEAAELIDSEQDQDNLLSVTVKLTRKRDRVRVAAVPPEEFLIDRNARSIDEALFVAHRTMKTVSDLVAMGYDEDTVLEQSEVGDELAMLPERIIRNPYAMPVGTTASPDPASRLVLYIESYPMVDTDGDGVAELVKVCTIGPSNKIVHWEPVESRNFADFCPDPEPHTFFGYSTADKTMDVQRVKSSLLRSALDSLSLSINPRTVVSEKMGGENVVADAMNTEIGAIIRSDDVNAVQPITAPDVSTSAFQAMNYWDQVKEARTGMSRVALGLDPQALQNTTATAAAGQFGQAQQHIELIARIFAECGMTRVFRGILRLVVENQRQSRMIQLRNKFVPMDPRGWRSDMDVIPNVGIGGGTDQEKAQVLSLVMQKQEQILLAKPDNPMVGLEQLHYAYSQFLQLAGFKNPDAFFKDPKNAEPAGPPPPPPPDPALVKVQQQGDLDRFKAEEAARLAELEAERNHELAVREMEGRLAIQAETNRGELALKERLLVSEMDLKRREVAAQLGLELVADAVEPSADEISTDAYSDVHPGGEPG